MSSLYVTDPKAHICPPSNATHPRDRWELLFVYSFVCKFTHLKGKEGLETPMDLEEALMTKEPHPILTKLLVQFILNLKPQTRNLSADQISATVAAVMSEYFKTSERTVFWDYDLGRNVDPFEQLQGGFFTAEWDFKLKILRQLVELQLTHGPAIKTAIDRAWGVMHNKHKKGQPTEGKPDPSDPMSQESLQLQPLGQDNSRKRYWITDESPRVYVSTNPWKTTASFHSVSSTREEYLALIEQLRKELPPAPKKGQKRSKLEQSHISLIESLEGRIEAIDADLARVAKVKKKMEQRAALMAQAELRETRTRRRTQRPDYGYGDAFGDEASIHEYKYQDDAEFDDEHHSSLGRRKRGAPSAPSAGTRRSTRTKMKPEPSPADPWQEWKGERRSTRLGGPCYDEEPVSKRAKTEESTISGVSESSTSGANGHSGALVVKFSGAAALKPTETAVEQIPGKKKSKFWVYAVEPIPGATAAEEAPLTSTSTLNDGDIVMTNGTKVEGTTSESNTAVDEAEWNNNGRSKSEMSYDISMNGSLSPMAADDA
ncbi:hypothetical protein FA15DRAFT_580265 [Coprinopsis marcescibilis]|uniref:WHIM1 domain-containing protein n=1 Tax=Coprinopsis marcescibilis TaxID=230819 RepID=A0A5C3LDK2_COPMA|nr:hypothetical protein FA15DRAFT_580265 [Coprinopsis marcescibilis]